MSFLLGGAYNVDSEARAYRVCGAKTSRCDVFRAWAVDVFARMIPTT